MLGNITRRGALLIAAGGLLAACGGNDADSNPSDPYDASGEPRWADPSPGAAERLALPSQITPTAVAWSPDGTTLAVGATGLIRLVPRSGASSTLKGHGTEEVCSVAWSPDGRRLASIGRDDSIHLWERSRPDKPLHVLKLREVSGAGSVAWSPRGDLLLATDGWTSMLIDVQAATPAVTVQRKGGATVLYGLAWAPDGNSYHTAGEHVTHWPLTGDQPLKQFTEPKVAFWSGVAVAADGRVALANRSGADIIRVYGPGYSAPGAALALPSGAEWVEGLKWNSAGTALAVGTQKPTVTVWSVTGLEGRQAAHYDGLRERVAGIAIDWQPGTGRLASADGDGVIHFWQPPTG